MKTDLPKTFFDFLEQYAASGKTVAVLFSDPSLIEEFVAALDAVRARSATLKAVLLDYYLHPLLKERGIEFKYISEFTEPDELTGLKAESEAMAQRWYCLDDQGGDSTVFENISLGELLEHDIGIVIQKIMKASADVGAFLKHTSPHALVLLTREAPPVKNFTSDVENNLYQKLLKVESARAGLPWHELRYPRMTPTPALEYLRRWHNTTSFDLPLFGWRMSLPSPLLTGLKSIYLVLHNLRARAQCKPRSAYILFASPTAVSYYGAHLVNRLLERTETCCTVFKGESRDTRIINYHGSRCAGALPDSLSHEIRGELLQRLDRFLGSPHAREHLAFRNHSLIDLIPEIFRSIFSEVFAHLLADIQTLRRLFADKPPRLILTVSDLAVSERLAIMVGKRFDIPSINLQHGIEGITQKSRRGFPRKATYKAAWSAKRKDWLVHMGHDADAVHIVGCHLQPDAPPSPLPPLEAPGCFLYFTHTGTQFFADRQPTAQINERIFRLLLAAMKSFPQKTLVVKTRPGDPQTRLYRQWSNESGCTNVWVTDADFDRWVRQCDLFLTLYSTAGAEAMMFGKPGIVLGFAERDKAEIIRSAGMDDIPFAEYGAALNLEHESADDLCALIRDIYRSPRVQKNLAEGRARFLRDYCNRGDGDPTEKFAALVGRILSSGRP